MRRPRHRPRSSARLSFSLLSVLALVAFACLPALAQAECTDSSCAEYEIEIPTAEGKKNKAGTSNGQEPSAEASNEGKGEAPGGEEDSEESEKSKAGGAPGNNGGGGGSGSTGGGSPSGQGSEGLQEGKPVPGTESGEQASHSSGGSSPLVPILIAVAVLAAISIGAVIYRQRRQGSGGSGSPVSPNA
ncbi:MAG: hypothetical protein AB7V58_07440 [Solirubrobacterales bacterium]